MLQNQTLESWSLQFKKSVAKAEKILLVAHKNPDGDTIGSATALFEIFQSFGKKCQIFCIDDFPADFGFLPHTENILRDFQVCDFDLVVTVDCGALHMTGIENFLSSCKTPILNIDHHASNESFGTFNLVDSGAASATLLIAELLRFLQVKISPTVATCLLCGICTDTGSFRHSNTDPRVLRAAGFLMRCGADLQSISKNIFRTHSLGKLKLWGRVLSRAEKNSQGFVVSSVFQRDLQETGSNSAELSGVIDFLNSVPDSDFSLLLTENEGKVKASFRTMKQEVDVAVLASRFGGGGHKKAAGFSTPGRLVKEVRWKIVQE